jgi:uncharacterized protein (TIGR00369 family)
MPSHATLAQGQAISAELEEAIMARIRPIPAYTALKVKIEHFEEGRCVAIVPIQPEYNGIFGSYHGGLLATAADTITCFALMTQIDPTEEVATTDLNIRYLAPCMTDVRVDARVIKCGRTLSPIEAKLYDLNDRLVAVAQVTYIRIPKKAHSIV